MVKAAFSAFQRACLDDLLGLTNGHEAAIHRKEVGGERETYAVLEIGAADGSPVKAWIYADECMLTAGERSFYFEKPDFRTEADLRSAVVAAVTDLLQGNEPRYSGSSRVNIFRGKPL